MYRCFRHFIFDSTECSK